MSIYAEPPILLSSKNGFVLLFSLYLYINSTRHWPKSILKSQNLAKSPESWTRPGIGRPETGQHPRQITES